MGLVDVFRREFRAQDQTRKLLLPDLLSLALLFELILEVESMSHIAKINVHLSPSISILWGSTLFCILHSPHTVCLRSRRYMHTANSIGISGLKFPVNGSIDQ